MACRTGPAANTPDSEVVSDGNASDAGEVNDVQRDASDRGVRDHFLKRGNRAAVGFVWDSATHVNKHRCVPFRRQLEETEDFLARRGWNIRYPKSNTDGSVIQTTPDSNGTRQR